MLQVCWRTWSGHVGLRREATVQKFGELPHRFILYQEECEGNVGFDYNNEAESKLEEEEDDDDDDIFNIDQLIIKLHESCTDGDVNFRNRVVY